MEETSSHKSLNARREARSRAGREVTLWGMLAGIFLVVFKLVGGIYGHSQAMIADAVHSLSDLLTDLVTLGGVIFSAKPEDRKHPYGHGKIETFFSFIIGVVLIVVAISIAASGFQSIMGEMKSLPTGIALVAAIVSIGIKEFLYQWNARAGRKLNSRIMIVNAWHHRTDAISSVAAFIGIGGAMLGYPYLDPIAAIVVAFIIVVSTYPILKGAFLELIETSVDEKVLNRIESFILQEAEVKEIRDLRARRVGPEIQVDVCICVDASLPLIKSHLVSENIERRIMENMEYVSSVVAHIEPYGVKANQEMVRELTERCAGEVRKLDGVAGFHGLEIQRRDNRFYVNIHVEVGPSMSVRQGNIISHKVEETLKECFPEIDEVMVHMDPDRDED
jgi:cation diffusion facilitator family transporter